jgi:S-adenosylmethionine-dependent methyltransferase
MVWESVRDLARSIRESIGGRPLDVLDVGGGTGGMAVPLALAGHEVTVLDPSPDALAALTRRAAEAGVLDRVRAVQADAAQLREAVPVGGADLVCCHGVLEYVDEPAAALGAVAMALRPGGVASLLVAQRSGAVLGRALAGRFAEASRALTDPAGRWGTADPLPRRFDLSALRGLVEAAGLSVRQVQGIRLFGDLVPEALIEGEAGRKALLDLERQADAHPDLAALQLLATQLHVLVDGV